MNTRYFYGLCQPSISWRLCKVSDCLEMQPAELLKAFLKRERGHRSWPAVMDKGTSRLAKEGQAAVSLCFCFPVTIVCHDDTALLSLHCSCESRLTYTALEKGLYKAEEKFSHLNRGL